MKGITLSGLDSSLYYTSELCAMARIEALTIDCRNDKKYASELCSIGRSGASLIVEDFQYYTSELCSIALACREGGNYLHLIDTGKKYASELCSIGRSGGIIYSSDEIERSPNDLCSIARACIEGGGRLIYYDFGHLYPNHLRNIRMNGGQIKIMCYRYPNDISLILG